MATQSNHKFLKFITALGFTLTVAGLALLLFPVFNKTVSAAQAAAIASFLILANYAILPLGLALFVGGIFTLIVRKKNESKSE